MPAIYFSISFTGKFYPLLKLSLFARTRFPHFGATKVNIFLISTNIFRKNLILFFNVFLISRCLFPPVLLPFRNPQPFLELRFFSKAAAKVSIFFIPPNYQSFFLKLFFSSNITGIITNNSIPFTVPFSFPL